MEKSQICLLLSLCLALNAMKLAPGPGTGLVLFENENWPVALPERNLSSSRSRHVALYEGITSREKAHLTRHVRKLLSKISKYLRLEHLKTLGKLAAKNWFYIVRRAWAIYKWVKAYRNRGGKHSKCRLQACKQDLECWIKETFCLVNKLKAVGSDLQGLSRQKKITELLRLAKMYAKNSSSRIYLLLEIVSYVLERFF